MRRATGGRFGAFVIAAGMMLCASAPLRANDQQSDTTEAPAAQQSAEAEPGKPVALNKFIKRKRSVKVARTQKPRVIAKGFRRKAIEADAASNAVPMSDGDQIALPEAVSNANAQWPAPDTGIQAVIPTPTAAQSGSGDVVAADQLNEVDKTLNTPPTGDDAASQIASKMTAQLAQNPSQAAGDNIPTTATPAMSAMASADRPEASSRDDNAWSQSSLIGKIFIAFGGLLTIASAARMFMA